ncbi:MAG: hypothetical protein OXE99_07335 [Cellvibrionales bacterium]|nr:hypothetical protein [Cellvibrionales bacterium]
MDLSIRDWLMVIGVLLLLAVALDGYRRARRERQNQVKLSKSAKRSARNYRTEDFKDEDVDYDRADVGSVRTVDNSDLSETKAPYDIDPLFEDPFAPQPATEAVSAVSPIDDSEPLSSSVPEIELPDETPEDLPAQPIAQSIAQPEEIILLNVMTSPPNTLNASKLKAILDACDCRYQANGVFYRFEKEHGQGDIQFSVVNMVEPGTFGNENLEGLETPGVSFLLCLPGPENPTEAINCMIETAQCVASNLGATIKDENLSHVTDQRLEYHRQQIRDFLQRKLLTADS